MCGLKAESLGRPGIQEQNCKLWIEAKQTEFDSEDIFVSISIDGKKIAVRPDGVEDMGGLGDASKDENSTDENQEIIKILELLKKDDRRSMFSLFDSLTVMSSEVIEKISKLLKLVEKNAKQVLQKPLLAKYVYILKQQLGTGRELVNDIQAVQSSVVGAIAHNRKSVVLLPAGMNSVNLENQMNFKSFPSITAADDLRNTNYIQRIIDVNWKSAVDETKFSVLDGFNTIFCTAPRTSSTFNQLYNLCRLSSRDIFKACGLRASRPVQDMKEVYSIYHSPDLSMVSPPPASPIIKATFCAILAPMCFGNNCNNTELGNKILDGVASTADMIVQSNSGSIDYVVLFCEKSESNVFVCDQENVATVITDASIHNSSKGGILIQYTDSMLVAFTIARSDHIVSSMIELCKSYLKLDKCIMKRSKDVISTIFQIRSELSNLTENVKVMGSFPLVKNVKNQRDQTSNTEDRASPAQPASHPSVITLTRILSDKRKFLSNQARELIAVNISDVSGTPSQSPHTILGGTFLSNKSLKLVGAECLNEISKIVSKFGARVVNYSTDGELLHLATECDGKPGTSLALAKFLFEQMKSFSKTQLISILSKNNKVDLSNTGDLGEDEANVHDHDDIDLNIDIEDELDNTIATIHDDQVVSMHFNLEDVEKHLTQGTENNVADQERVDICKNHKAVDLRRIGVKHIFQSVKKGWILESIGSEHCLILFSDGTKIEYYPNTIFKKSDQGGFVTVTFDMAHLSNLFRECGAKGRLENMGLKKENLRTLSEKPKYEYLKKILALENNKLKFDSMNQHASALLFSELTVEGLREMNDYEGAACVEKISNGLIKALDDRGIPSETRIKYLVALKQFMEDKNKLLSRLSRPDSKNITNELYQMVLCSIDSHILSSINIQFFNPRRKSTAGVEQFFSQMMLLADHGNKLDHRQISDILSRVMIINALRLLPINIKGFPFLTKLNVHMKSYTAPTDEEIVDCFPNSAYPKWLQSSSNCIHPANSYFDQVASKRKVKYYKSRKSEVVGTDGHYRKYHKKF